MAKRVSIAVSAAAVFITLCFFYTAHADTLREYYELLFGFDPLDSEYSDLDYDSDDLTNLEEFYLWTDPYVVDTDRDGWPDAEDDNPISRAYIDWGSTNYTVGDEFVYVGPPWWLWAEREGGEWTNGAWHVDGSVSNDVGALLIGLDRDLMRTNLRIRLEYVDHDNASLFIDLLDDTEASVTSNLFGNLLNGTDGSISNTWHLPLESYTNGAIVRIRRGTGPVTVDTALLYVDIDGDGLDEDQELQLGTSDHNPDTVPPEIYCQALVGALNVLANPSFEAGGGGGSQSIDHWSLFGNVYQEPIQPRTGTYHVKVYGNFTSSVNYSGIYQDHAAAPGEVWRAYARLMTDSNDALSGNNRLIVKVEFLDSSEAFLGAVESSKYAGMAEDAYMALVAQGVAPSGTAKVRIAILLEQDASNSGGSVFVDDAALEQVVTHLDLVCEDEIPEPDPDLIIAVDDEDPTPTVSLVDTFWTGGTGCDGSPRTFTRVWEAEDHAGNRTQCQVTYTIEDNVPPSISVPPANLNFLKNPGVEEGAGAGTQVIDHWHLFGQVYQEADTPQSGVRHAKLFGNFTSQVNYSGMYQDHATASGEVWRATAWVLHPFADPLEGDNVAELKLEFYDEELTSLATATSEPFTAATPSDVYRRLMVSAEAPEGAAWIRTTMIFAQDADDAFGSVYVDDLGLERLSKQPPPPDSGIVQASDNCGGSVTVSHEGDFAGSGTGCFGDPYTVTRVWRATDACGNYTETNQVFVYEDTLPPVLTVPSDIFLLGEASTHPTNTGTATASGDFHEIITVSYTDVVFTASCPDYDAIHRTWIAEDDCGNTAEATQIITLAEDTDGDGIPDCWEILYFGGATNAVASADPDEDGLTNLEEYLAGTDPTTVDSDGDGISDGDEVNLHGTDPTLADTDGDGMPDGWEIANGLNPLENDAFEDPDQDDLANIFEYLWGTDPMNPDSDGDGVPDGLEVLSAFSDPAVEDFTLPTDAVASINGADATVLQGTWQPYDSSIFALSSGGRVSFDFNLASNGYYVFTLEGTQFDPQASRNVFVLDVSVGGVDVGRRLLRADFGLTGKEAWFLPHLPAGEHTVTVTWHYRSNNGSLRILTGNLVTICGPDENENGECDWLDNRRINIFDMPSSDESWVSPYSLEGTAPRWNYLSITSSMEGVDQPIIRPGVLHDWYAHVDLSPTADVHVVVSADSGEIVRTNVVTWVPLNLFEGGIEELVVRAGDTVMFSADPAEATNGTTTIEIVGQTNHTLSLGERITHGFATDGEYTVEATWSNSVDSASTYITVRAVSALFSAAPFVHLHKQRQWDNPDLPSDVYVQADPRIETHRTDLPTGGTRLYLRMREFARHVVVARLYEGGPVLDSVEIESVYVYSTQEGDSLKTVHRYEDGTRIVMLRLHMSAIPDDLILVIDAFTAGVTLLDGSAQLILTAADFDENGDARVYFVVDPEWEEGICHLLTVYQGGEFVGIR